MRKQPPQPTSSCSDSSQSGKNIRASQRMLEKRGKKTKITEVAKIDDRTRKSQSIVVALMETPATKRCQSPSVRRLARAPLVLRPRDTKWQETLRPRTTALSWLYDHSSTAKRIYCGQKNVLKVATLNFAARDGYTNNMQGRETGVHSIGYNP